MSQPTGGRFKLSDQRTIAQVQKLQDAFPIAGVHRSALQILGSDFSYVRKNDDNTWTALIHFGQAIQGTFGFTRDVAVLYTDSLDVQPRLFRQLPTRLITLPEEHEAESNLFLLASRDPNATRKLDRWSEETNFTAISLPTVKDERSAATQISECIRMRLAVRNLYDERDPVTGRDFFGRKQLLAQLVEELRQGNVCGVFGLRKTGKTSLIGELGKRFQLEEDKHRIFVLVDLESLPSNEQMIISRLLIMLRDALVDELQSRGVRVRELIEFEDSNGLGGFQSALQRAIRSARDRGVSVVVALDEVESLVGDADVIRHGNRPGVPEVLGMLRALVQQNSNFNVIFSGITSSLIEIGYLFNRENPLFSWAKAYYLPPMSKGEIGDLTREVGQRMHINWHPNALALMYEISGGNVFIHRTLAAEIVKSLDDASGRLIHETHVEKSLHIWRRQFAQSLSEMLEAARRHYPDEVELLELYFDDRETFEFFEQSQASAVARLVNLALLRDADDGELEPGALSRHLVEIGVL